MTKSKGKNDTVLDLQKLNLTQFSVDNAADAIFWLNEKGRFIYANKAAAVHSGYSRRELLEMTVHQIDCKFSKGQWQRHWQRLRKRKTMKFETIHRSKAGKDLPVEISVSYIELDNEEFHCVYVRDISDRKMAEIALQKSENRFRKTLDVTSDGMWDRNLLTGEEYYGSNWATALGYSKDDLVTGKISWVKLLHSEDKDMAMQAVRDHLDGKTTNYEAEFRLRNNDNYWQWIHARGKVIEYDSNGKPARFVGTHTDITNRKEAEYSLQRSSEQTKLFAYSVAHDLKNPAIAIQCLAERLREKLFDLSDEKKQQYCDQLLNSTDQIVALIEKINSYTSSKETQPVLEDVPLKEIVRLCREEFAAQLQIRGIAWGEFHEHPIVKVDRLSIIRVLRNLVENSLKYGGKQLSKITIGYQNTSGFHVISVRDNGLGIKAEDCENIFKPFERRGSSLGQGGAGLGLAIVKEIADQHKGEVWVEQSRKRGLQFCFAIAKNL